jgi:predicted lipoprotein
VSGRDSLFDMNVSVDEEEALPGIVGMSVHRCSMIKKYNIETFFSPAKQMHHRRAATTATDTAVSLNNAQSSSSQAFMPVSERARFEPVDYSHPTNID